MSLMSSFMSFLDPLGHEFKVALDVMLWDIVVKQVP